MNIQERTAPSVDEIGSLASFIWQNPSAEFVEQLPVAAYACDARGRILWFNSRAAELWGRAPRVDDDSELFCGSYKLYLDGRLISREQTPMAEVLKTGISVRGLQGGLERPDGSYIWVVVHISPILDEYGGIAGAINCFDQRVSGEGLQASDARPQDQLARRMEEQAALFAFSEKLQHCTARAEVFDAALDAITRALGCERASVLLFDAADVMRFVAWRGLSESYRRAVEGHSPWAREEADPRPVCIEDVTDADLPSDLKRAILSEGIQATAFIPIVEDGRLCGKFMTYHASPHHFTETELDVGLTLARLLGFSMARLAGEAARKVAERDAQHLAAIVESSEDAIVSKDLGGIVQTWNAGAERLFGFARDEIVGRPITLLIPDDRLDEEPEILAKIRAGKRVDHFETVRRRKDGNLIDISLTISPIRDRAGRIVGASKIARDITARKLTEKRLRESEQRLQELLAAIPAAIYTTDAEGKITYFNQGAVEFAGRTPTIGSDEWCVTWKLYHPDGTPLPHDQCPMAVALKEGRPVRGAEAVAERPDGTRVPFIPFPTPLRDDSGKVVGAINMLVDLSERKQAETQQRLLLNELNHRTKNNMQMLQSLLSTAARSTKSEEARHVLDEAGGRIAAMAAAQRVLYGTTDASRFSAEKFLSAVVETVQQTLRPEVRIVRASANSVLSNDVAMPLALILNELLTNAAKHGVNDAAQDGVRVGFTEGNGRFELYVEDDGPGFDLDAVRDTSSGLRLVLGLARQLHADFAVTRMPSRATLCFAAGRGA